MRTGGIAANCTCLDGFFGDACDGLTCPGGDPLDPSRECSNHGTCELSADGSAPACSCYYGWTGTDCGTDAGTASFIYSIAIGGGILGFGILVGVAVYCLRASRSGRFIGPTEAYQHRQWARASTTYGLGSMVAVHTPKRVAIAPAWQAAVKNGGVRARIGPG